MSDPQMDELLAEWGDLFERDPDKAIRVAQEVRRRTMNRAQRRAFDRVVRKTEERAIRKAKESS